METMELTDMRGVFMDKLRVVHYVNQFFGQIGGEEAADTGVQTVSGAVGPGLGLAKALGTRAEIVCTIICGDGYFNENAETALSEVMSVISEHNPDMFFAGPAFNAGRYGVACGMICAEVKKRLGIPAVTAMFEENPGREIYATDIFILKAPNNARKMADTVSRMAVFGYKLLDGTIERNPEEEGFFERGWMVLQKHEDMASKRAVDMLLNKVAGKPFKTEIPMPLNEKADAPPPLMDLKGAVVLLATDGALCPQGNPDGVRVGNSVVYNEYSIEGKDSLTKEEYTCVHGGFDTSYVLEDPNRLVPLDAMRALENEGVTRFHGAFLSTSGLVTGIAASTKMGREMAAYVKDHNIDAVILTST
jgi:glycine reductase